MIVLCGKSGSGKSTIQNELVRWGFRRIVTYTTRPMRPNEQDGVAYHFLSPSIFEEKRRNGDFLETTSFQVSNGDTWFYGTDRTTFTPKGVIVLNPSGVKALRNDSAQINYKTLICYIGCPTEILKRRLAYRGDAPEEIERRLSADEKDFEDILSYVDFSVANDGSLSLAQIVHNILTVYEENRYETF